MAHHSIEDWAENQRALNSSPGADKAWKVFRWQEEVANPLQITAKVSLTKVLNLPQMLTNASPISC